MKKILIATTLLFCILNANTIQKKDYVEPTKKIMDTHIEGKNNLVRKLDKKYKIAGKTRMFLKVNIGHDKFYMRIKNELDNQEVLVQIRNFFIKDILYEGLYLTTEISIKIECESIVNDTYYAICSNDNKQTEFLTKLFTEHEIYYYSFKKDEPFNSIIPEDRK